MKTIKKRKILLPITINSQYWSWLDEEGFDYEIIFSDCQGKVFSNAGENLLKHIVENGGDNYLILFHMPSKNIDLMNGIDIAQAIKHKLKLNIPVIISSTIISETFLESFYFTNEKISNNIIAVDNFKHKHTFINLVKKAIQFDCNKTILINH